MSSRNTKRLLKILDSLPSPPVRPSKNGYWPCPLCSTINQAAITVIHGADDEPVMYAVSERLTCRGVTCGHTFEALAPVQGVVVPMAAGR